MHRSLVVACVLVLGATVPSTGSAAGVDLNWNQCLYSAGDRIPNLAALCDPADPAASNGQAFRLIGSVRTGLDLDHVVAWGADIDIQTANSPLDSWWQMGPGECREASVTFIINGFPNVTACNKNLMVASPAPLSISNYATFYGGAANRARWSMAAARSSLTPTTVVATTKYQLFISTFDSRFSVADPAQPSDPVCAGCSDAACLVLSHVEVDQYDAATGAQALNHFYTPEIASWVSWNGGSVPETPCAGQNTPVQRATWGQVKSLYR